MAKGIMYVDNIRVEFDDEATIMDVCRKAGVEMPNFCFHLSLQVVCLFHHRIRCGNCL